VSYILVCIFVLEPSMRLVIHRLCTAARIRNHNDITNLAFSTKSLNEKVH